MSAVMSREQRILDLMQSSGYNIVQHNGQRVFGPPPDWPTHVPSPAKGCEVFIGRLPRDCYEDELVPVLASIGTIYQLRLMMDFSGTNRGFAFVTYTKRSDAIRAVTALNNHEIRPNKRIGVVHSVDNCRLFIGNIPLNKTRIDIIEELANKDVEGVVNAILYYNTYNKLNSNSIYGDFKNRGFAFVEFRSHRDAAMARRKLLPGKIKLFDSDISVDWAIPEPILDDNIMSKVTALFVRYLSSEATEDDIKEFFSLRDIFNLTVQRVKRIKNYAFVHFNSREEAEKAFHFISKTDLSQTPINENGLQLEVMWAKPPSSVSPNHRKNYSIPSYRDNSLELSLNSSSYSNASLNPMAQPFDPKSVHSCNSTSNRMNGVMNKTRNFLDRTQALGSSKGLSLFWSNDPNESMQWVHHTPPSFRLFK